jgi:hypothetical protein
MTLAPEATITLDGRRLTSAEAGIRRLVLTLSVDRDHDAAEVVLWRRSKLAAATPGATLAIALDGDDVWTGEVTEVERAADAVTLYGLATTVALSRRRISQTYTGQSVADIVRDLASPLDVDEVQGDTQLDAYSIDDRRAVWSHLQDLAELVGAEVGSSAAGALRFVPPRQGAADVTLRYGADVIAWRAGPVGTRLAARVAAYGAGSEAGADRWHWVLATPSPAGGGEGPVRIMPALRTRDAAETMGRALAERARRATIHGEVRLWGRAALRPGNLVAITDLPGGDLGPLRVLGLEQRVDARMGFVTTARVEAAGGSAGGLSL